MMELKVKSLEEQLGKQKKSTDEMLKALINIDQEEKELWNKLESAHHKNNETLNKLELAQRKNESLVEELESMKKDQEFMKKLILIANDSYEELQKNCRRL